ncbi:MAG: IS3 family transposase [Candidatus Nanopelagicales bacterium]
MAHLERKFQVSERRACRLVGQHRSTNRYAAAPVDFERKLVARMTKLAERHPRWGYRMVHALLVEEGWPVNKKRIERLWRQEGLQVPPARLKNSGQKAIGEDANSAWMLPAVRPNHVWSYDFVSARTVDGGSLRILNVIDENTRVALGSHVARSIGAVEVTRHLERLFDQHGKPAFIRADNGREFIADTVQEWLAAQQVRPVYVAKASPQQNCYIERFNGSMRRELLNGEQFHSVLEAKVVIDDWLVLYNTRRAHRGLGGKTPAAYAKMARSQHADDRIGGGG